MPCRVLINGRTCRATPIRGTDYCFSHRRHRLAATSVTLAELWSLAEVFDGCGADGVRCSAAEFVEWLRVDLEQRPAEPAHPPGR